MTMGNKSTQKPPRQHRPVNPSQQEQMIMRRMMEEAIATRVRVEDQARQVQAELQQTRLLLAGLLLHREDHTAVLHDDDLAELSLFAGFDIDRDEEAETLTLRLILADVEVDDESS
jgi:hypothetical protein